MAGRLWPDFTCLPLTNRSLRQISLLDGRLDWSRGCTPWREREFIVHERAIEDEKQFNR